MNIDEEHTRFLIELCMSGSRSTKLIVNGVDYINSVGSFKNHDWSFIVKYSFKDCLDIKKEKRMIKKVEQYVWTQGGIINFKTGDMLYSNDREICVQVTQSTPVVYNKDTGKLYEGSVVYEEFDVDHGKLKKKGYYISSHMNFCYI